MKKLALRIDDIGASSKQFEIYSKKMKGFGNFLFLKRLKPFAAWGPYREMTPEEWKDVFRILEENNAKLTVGVTASWVDFNGKLTPFHEMFPEQAKLLKEADRKGLIEIANHGLTHCVLKSNLFRPKLFRCNRKFHREFWPWIKREDHFQHIERSQNILQNYFDKKIETFIPPGNVYSEDTLDAAIEYGIKYVNCNTTAGSYKGLKIISNDEVIAFHDKEIVEMGPSWLESKIKKDLCNWVFVKELE